VAAKRPRGEIVAYSERVWTRNYAPATKKRRRTMSQTQAKTKEFKQATSKESGNDPKEVETPSGEPKTPQPA